MIDGAAHMIRLTDSQRWALVALVAGYIDTRWPPDESEAAFFERVGNEDAEDIRMFMEVFRALYPEIGAGEDWRARLRELRAHLRKEADRIELGRREAGTGRRDFTGGSAH